MKLFATALIAAATSVGAHAQEATVAYDAADGSLLLTIGEGLFGASIVSELNLLDLTAVNSSTALGAPNQLTEGTDEAVNTVGFSATAPLPTGTFNVGQLVTPGLSIADLGNFGVSFSGPGITDGFNDVTAVPEPASLALLGLGGIALLGRRRGV